MSGWFSYGARVEARGKTRREEVLKREVRYLTEKLPHNLSCFTAEIDGEEMQVAIIHSDNMDEKYIYPMPGETILPGSIVFWSDFHWLVTEQSASPDLYISCKMVQCNHVLRWVNDDDEIIERWCVVEDGTKYMTGELEDRDFIVTRGDSRIAVTIPRDSETVKLGRKNRFLIDDEDAMPKAAFELTKPLKLGAIYNGHGVYKFVLTETTRNEDDNNELGIADYYKHFPNPNGHITGELQIDPIDNTNKQGREGWL